MFMYVANLRYRDYKTKGLFFFLNEQQIEEIKGL